MPVKFQPIEFLMIICFRNLRLRLFIDSIWRKFEFFSKDLMSFWSPLPFGMILNLISFNTSMHRISDTAMNGTNFQTRTNTFYVKHRSNEFQVHRCLLFKVLSTKRLSKSVGFILCTFSGTKNKRIKHM